MTYLIPAEEIRRELVFSNSRFIATLAPVASPDEARTFLHRIREEFADASHNVPAYILGGGNSFTEYCSDDGEPSGTAGRPALAVLRGSGLGDLGVVVTRYFGGTLLGKGGLVRAYTQATQLVVREVPRAQRVAIHVVGLVLPYALLERVRLLVPRFGGVVRDEFFTGEVKLTLHFPVDELPAFQGALQELSGGSMVGEILETTEALIRVTDR
jgi:uncharacterized YigZ family protein